MRFLFCLLAALFCLLHHAAAQDTEYVILSGGPALRKWEDLRRSGEQHDRWWANFIATAATRIKELRQANPQMPILWLVYRDAYARRSMADGKPYLQWIAEKQAKYNCRVVFFSSGRDVIGHMNAGRSQRKIGGFEFYGHSNKHCFMFDYSSDNYGTSSSWLHEVDLKYLNRSSFARNAYCHSWGCHTGESMSAVWKKVTGLTLIGAVGKTDYTDLHLRDNHPALGSGSHWRR
jgi:hypothetical protein